MTYRRATMAPRQRDPAAIKRSAERQAFVANRCQAGAEGLNDWLVSQGVTAWGSPDAGIALDTIRKTLGDAAWRKALDVVVPF